MMIQGGLQGLFGQVGAVDVISGEAAHGSLEQKETRGYAPSS